ncbi:UDP-galactose transporter [Mucor velutinosus]|uniref:UDP-galactose transporter n=1 Tax=Mucor velutinosus TaxID=708070 RepID=A0AAN7DDT6_9FUNG|nr:UDP-galactose transporter [Mucor velutinosus]
MAKRKVSCLPCRIKKVKCDGEKPCTRCEARQTACIYQKPGAVGRPPKNAVVNKLVLSRIASNIHDNKEGPNSKTFCREFIFENVTMTPVLAPVRYLHDNTEQGLDFYINTLFSTYFAKNTTLDQFIEERRSENAVVLHPDYASVNTKVKIFDLTDYFTWMSADMASILMKRVSKLKLTYYTDLEFSRTALAYDRTTSFFESPSSVSLTINPLNSLPPQQAVRLIECFFCIHPFSNLLNKTMLLQAYWTDTADPLLLTVVYGTTIFKSQLLDGKPLELWDALNKKKRNPFLDYAHVLLSKASAETTPSKYQAIVLLALFEVTFGFPKRGMSLFGLSYMLAARLGLFDNSMPAGLSDVEKELLLNTFWAAFETTIRGCVELEQIPRAALAYHEHPYPPPNIKLSKSYQYDVENNNPRLFKWYFYLLETFYIKSVIARVSCKLILQLPHSSDPTLPKAPWQVLSRFRPELFKPYPKLQPNVEERISQVLDEFQQFNDACRKDWSPLQAYTLDLFYLFYRINMYFIRDSVRNPDGRNHPFSLYQQHTPTELDLTNVDNVLRVHKAIPESIQLLARTYTHLINPVNYYDQTDFLPRGIIISAVDSAAQVLMYAYRLEASDQLRQHIEKAEAILNIPIIWGDWGTCELLRTVIHNFLDANPVLPEKDKTATGREEPSLSSNSSVSTHENDAPSFDNVDLNDDSTDLITSFLPPTANVFPADTTQPPAPPSTSNFIMTPWLTGQEPWTQDINQILSNSDLLSAPFVDPFQPQTQEQLQPQPQPQPQQTHEQQQFEFVSDLFDGLF